MSILEVKEVLFDFEGTLVDFQWKIEPAVKECLAALSKAGFKRKWYGTNPGYAYIYNHTRSLSMEGNKHACIDKNMAIIDGIYDRYDAEAMTRWNLYSDTLDMLETLRHMGFHMGVISNIGSESLRTAMDRLELSDSVAIVVSRNEVKRLKPDPEGLLKAAAVLGVEPAQCIFIGDSVNDVNAARGAGMLSGHLAGGEDSRETMAHDPADVEIERLNQLPRMLSRIV